MQTTKKANRLNGFQDNLYYLKTRDTCIFYLNTTERENLEYEDGLPIGAVVYQ